MNVSNYRSTLSFNHSWHNHIRYRSLGIRASIYLTGQLGLELGHTMLFGLYVLITRIVIKLGYPICRILTILSLYYWQVAEMKNHVRALVWVVVYREQFPWLWCNIGTAHTHTLVTSRNDLFKRVAWMMIADNEIIRLYLGFFWGRECYTTALGKLFLH